MTYSLPTWHSRDTTTGHFPAILSSLFLMDLTNRRNGRGLKCRLTTFHRRPRQIHPFPSAMTFPLPPRPPHQPTNRLPPRAPAYPPPPRTETPKSFPSSHPTSTPARHPPAPTRARP